MSNRGVNDLPEQYDLRRYPFMQRAPDFMPQTETYVSIPPALVIRDEQNNVWTLGFDYDEREWKTGRFEYDIICNGRKTGEFGRNIEYRRNSHGDRVVRIWGADGWRSWNGRTFV